MKRKKYILAILIIIVFVIIKDKFEYKEAIKKNNINLIEDEILNGTISFNKDIFIDKKYKLKLIVEANVEENII